MSSSRTSDPGASTSSAASLGAAGAAVIHVVQAENGVQFDVGIQRDTTLMGQVRAALANKLDVAAQDLILLANGAKLDDKKLATYYKLEQSDRVVFMYLRQTLQGQSSVQRLVEPQWAPLAFPPAHAAASAAAAEHGAGEDEGLSPFDGPLQDLVAYFAHESAAALAAQHEVNSRVLWITTNISEQANMARALEAAVLNLTAYEAQLVRSYAPIKKRFDEHMERERDLLDTCDAGVAELARVPLHEALRTEGRTTLADCVPMHKLGEWKDMCQRVYAAFVEQARALDAQVQKTHKDVMEQHSDKPEHFVMLQQVAAEARQIDQMANDYARAVQDGETMARQYAASGGEPDPLVAIDSLRSRQALVERDKKQLVDGAERLLRFARDAVNNKNELTTLVLTRVRTVGELQNAVRSLVSSLLMLSDSLPAQYEPFEQLELVKKLPQVYREWISEIVQRRRFQDRFGALVTRVAEHLAELSGEEQKRRDSFITAHGRHVPRVLAHGIGEPAPRCDVQHFFVASSQLPVIDGDTSARDEDADDVVVEDVLAHLRATSERWIDAEISVSPLLAREMRDLQRANAKLVADLEAAQQRVTALEQQQLSPPAAQRPPLQVTVASRDTSQPSSPAMRSGSTARVGRPLHTTSSESADVGTPLAHSVASVGSDAVDIVGELRRAYEERITALTQELDAARAEVARATVAASASASGAATLAEALRRAADAEADVTRFKELFREQTTLNARLVVEGEELREELTLAQVKLQSTQEHLQLLEQRAGARSGTAADATPLEQQLAEYKSLTERMSESCRRLGYDLRPDELLYLTDSIVPQLKQKEAELESRICFRSCGVGDLCMFVQVGGTYCLLEAPPAAPARGPGSAAAATPIKLLSGRTLSALQSPLPTHVIGVIRQVVHKRGSENPDENRNGVVVGMPYDEVDLEIKAVPKVGASVSRIIANHRSFAAARSMSSSAHAGASALASGSLGAATTYSPRSVDTAVAALEQMARDGADSSGSTTATPRAQPTQQAGAGGGALPGVAFDW